MPGPSGMRRNESPSAAPPCSIVPCRDARFPQPVPAPTDDQPAEPFSNDPLDTRFRDVPAGVILVNLAACVVWALTRTSRKSSVPGSVNQTCRRLLSAVSCVASNTLRNVVQRSLTAISAVRPHSLQSFVLRIATETPRRHGCPLPGAGRRIRRHVPSAKAHQPGPTSRAMMVSADRSGYMQASNTASQHLARPTSAGSPWPGHLKSSRIQARRSSPQ